MVRRRPFSLSLAPREREKEWRGGVGGGFGVGSQAAKIKNNLHIQY